MHHIYCISGLGADHRLFDNLQLNNAQLHFIDWILPAETDTLQTYAQLLATQIKHPEIVLMGVSFGGMLATAITTFAQQHPQPYSIKKTIIISSCKSPAELPLLMKWAGKLGLHRIMPYKLILRSASLNRFLFDLRSRQEELYLKLQMLQGNTPEIIERSINLILTWIGDPEPTHLVHIHGNADRLLTPANIKADFWIEDGGHFMVWNKAPEISVIINTLLSNKSIPDF